MWLACAQRACRPASHQHILVCLGDGMLCRHQRERQLRQRARADALLQPEHAEARSPVALRAFGEQQQSRRQLQLLWIRANATAHQNGEDELQEHGNADKSAQPDAHEHEER